MNTLQINRNQIFVHNLPYKLSKEDIIEYFSSYAGDILNISFASKRGNPTKGNPGKCYIQFKDEISASKAMKLNGQCILGQPIFIKTTSSSARNDISFPDNYAIPMRRFQTIRRQCLSNRYEDTKSDFDEKSGRFKGGYLLSEDFNEYCSQVKRVQPITYEVKPVFPNLLDSSFYSSYISA